MPSATYGPLRNKRRRYRLASSAILVVGWIRGFSAVQIARATEPMLSRDSYWVLQLKFSRKWHPWAVWSVGFCGVRFAIYSPRRARGTAKPERFDMFRVAERPATHAGSKPHKFNANRRGERPRFVATLPIGHELRGGSLLVTADPAFGCGSFSRARDFGHLPLLDAERRVLECLGAALVSEWNDLPTDVQRRLFEHAASGKSHGAAILKARIARFLHNHKDDWAAR
jgi:hypothetical protein